MQVGMRTCIQCGQRMLQMPFGQRGNILAARPQGGSCRRSTLSR
jgi:hypothetical protein